MSTDIRTALSFDTRSVLKEGELFLVCDLAGDIRALSTEGQGLYFRDTRFLSMYQMTVEGMDLSLLSAAGDQSFVGTLQFANQRGVLPNGTAVEARTISVRRNRFIRDGLHERVGFFSFNPFPVDLTVKLAFGSDFRDMFDVRGYAKQARRGMISPPTHDGRSLWLSYLGADGVLRRTQISFEEPPTEIEVFTGEACVPAAASPLGPREETRVMPPHVVATYRFTLPPQQAVSITLHVDPLLRDAVAPVVPLDIEYDSISDSYREWAGQCTSIISDNELFNAMVQRALYDIRLLMTDSPSGSLPAAGIPWFSVPFGRDSLITSYQTLMLRPDIALGTLRFLAWHQGREFDDWRDEEPGKILHEIRFGEMARTGQVPHDSYYGTVDATPLFLILLTEYVRWTEDWSLVAELRDPMMRALEWVRCRGGLDGDGFLEYRSRSTRGIRNQGWKDSPNSVVWRDGTLVEPPIALVEVQGYGYDARIRVAGLLRGLGEDDLAQQLLEEADRLRERFERKFWMEGEGYYAQALDAKGRPVPSITSNVGHCLWSGIVSPDRARRVVGRLMAGDMLTGWGIRTMSELEPNFNPMSYHNGSIWPHDNSLIAAGLKRYGYDEAVCQLFTELYEAGLRFGGYRLPELYCGFDRDRRYQSMPAQYPVSCSPQAWAAGSVFLLLQQTLGLRPAAGNSTIQVRPALPAWLNQLSLRHLRVGDQELDLNFERKNGRIQVDVSNPHVNVVMSE